MIVRRSKAEVAKMALAGRVLAECLDMLVEAVRPGVTTGELDELAEKFIRVQGGKPTFLG